MKIMTDQDLTRSQHYVARTYQKGWSPRRWQVDGYPTDCVVWIHDLVKKQERETGPNALLTSNWFYESNKAAPDNEHEKWFGDFESAYAKTMRFIDSILTTVEKNIPAPDLGQGLASALAEIAKRSPELMIVLKEFAALSYARTPAMMLLKHGELKADATVGPELANALTEPYTFIQHFRESTLLQRFNSLNIQFWISPEKGFLTCDRPCYDFGDVASGHWPLSGYDIGRRDDVAAFMPLTPRVAMLMAPTTAVFLGKKMNFAPFSTKVITNESLDVANTMTINMAGRWVIGSERLLDIYERREMPLRKK